jgi:hypothetical protein
MAKKERPGSIIKYPIHNRNQPPSKQSHKPAILNHRPHLTRYDSLIGNIFTTLVFMAFLLTSLKCLTQVSHLTFIG